MNPSFITVCMSPCNGLVPVMCTLEFSHCLVCPLRVNISCGDADARFVLHISLIPITLLTPRDDNSNSCVLIVCYPKLLSSRL
jgi:hypothetical protein